MAKAEHHVGGMKAVHMDRTERSGKRKKLHRLEVSRAKNGGHVVKHHYMHGPDMPFMEPQEHVFGKADGAALMAHLGRHLGVKGGLPAVPEPAVAGEPAEAGDEEEVA